MVRTAIEIWQPRWKDKTVLIACHKVRDGENFIRFTKARSLPGLYSVDGGIIRSSPRCSNGRIECYAVALAELKTVEEEIRHPGPMGGIGSDVYLDDDEDYYED